MYAKELPLEELREQFKQLQIPNQTLQKELEEEKIEQNARLKWDWEHGVRSGTEEVLKRAFVLSYSVLLAKRGYTGKIIKKCRRKLHRKRCKKRLKKKYRYKKDAQGNLEKNVLEKMSSDQTNGMTSKPGSPTFSDDLSNSRHQTKTKGVKNASVHNTKTGSPLHNGLLDDSSNHAVPWYKKTWVQLVAAAAVAVTSIFGGAWLYNWLYTSDPQIAQDQHPEFSEVSGGLSTLEMAKIGTGVSTAVLGGAASAWRLSRSSEAPEEVKVHSRNRKRHTRVRKVRQVTPDETHAYSLWIVAFVGAVLLCLVIMCCYTYFSAKAIRKDVIRKKLPVYPKGKYNVKNKELIPALKMAKRFQKFHGREGK